MIEVDFAKITTEVLNYDAKKVLVGNSGYNFKEIDWTSGIIVVKEFLSRHIGSSDIQNVVTNELTAVENYDAVITLDFYGEKAKKNLKKFTSLIRKDKASLIASQYNITLNRVSNSTNLSRKTGTQWKYRYQAEIPIFYYTEFVEELEIIQTPQIDFIVNK